ncbi:MAG: WYL domain-containing protein [Cyanobacteria bacterium J06592_8]
MSRKGQSITLSLSESEKAELEQLALEYGMTWGERPNISKLLKAIADHKLLITPNNDWSQERIKALDTARLALIDAGKMAEAVAIGELLRDRSELTIPFRTEIESFVNNPQPAWRQKIDNLIQRQQPFQLFYQDAAERQWSYTVLHARIMPIEKRDYLICRCQESEGNRDIEGLQHNWSLRLDRIQDAAVTSVDQTWLSDLERITVEFHVYRGLAFAYRKNQLDDIFVSEIESEPARRRVIRSIFSSFWFFREIAPYWEDCEIISPESVRQRVQEKVRLMCQQYDLE